MSYMEPLPSAFKSPACSFWKCLKLKTIVPAPRKSLSMDFHVCSYFKGSAVNKVDILAPCTLGCARDRSIFGWERNANRGKHPHHKSTRQSTYPEQGRGASLPRAELLHSDLYQLESKIHRPQVFQLSSDCTTYKKHTCWHSMPLKWSKREMAVAETHPLYRTDINHKDWQSSFNILIF